MMLTPVLKKQKTKLTKITAPNSAQPKENIMNEIQLSGRTATVRTRCAAASEIILLEHGFSGNVLHFGSGRDHHTAWNIAESNYFDVKRIVNYDPNNQYFQKTADVPPSLYGVKYEETNELPKEKFNQIICNYVMDALPLFYRNKAMRDLVSCLDKKGTAYITVRGFSSPIEDTIEGTPEQDGYRTTQGIFHRVYSVKDYSKYLHKYFNSVRIIHGGLTEIILIAECKEPK